MKKIVLITLCLITIGAQAQLSLGIVAEPAYNVARIGATPQNSSDSLKALKTNAMSLSLGLEIRKQIDRYQSFSVIPTFYQTNMTLVKQNLQFLDVIHPQLPEIRDLSQGSTKVAYLKYRQQYIGAQFLYNKVLQLRKMPNKSAIELNGGLGLYYLVNGDIKVTTEGFAIKNDFTQVIKDSLGIDNRPYHINLSLGSDFTYEVLPKVTLAAGIRIPIPITSTTSSLPKITIYNPAIRVSLRKSI
ncbi:MAG: hypothetical protein ACI9GO_000868 [Bacteroidia bacterium]|jgi:hypothetical protein